MESSTNNILDGTWKYGLDTYKRVLAIIQRYVVLKPVEGYNTFYTASRSLCRDNFDNIYNEIIKSNNEQFIAHEILKIWTDSPDTELANLIRDGLIRQGNYE